MLVLKKGLGWAGLGRAGHRGRKTHLPKAWLKSVGGQHGSLQGKPASPLNHRRMLAQHEVLSPFSFSHQVTSEETEHPKDQIFARSEVSPFLISDLKDECSR